MRTPSSTPSSLIPEPKTHWLVPWIVLSLPITTFPLPLTLFFDPTNYVVVLNKVCFDLSQVPGHRFELVVKVNLMIVIESVDNVFENWKSVDKRIHVSVFLELTLAFCAKVANLIVTVQTFNFSHSRFDCLDCNRGKF